MNRFTAGVLGVLALIVATAPDASAQMGNYTLEEGERNLKFAAIPIPNYNPVMGWGLGLLGAVYYKIDREDHLCPPSTSGVFGFYSSNESWAGAVFQKVHYDEDKWRGTLAAARASVNFQFHTNNFFPRFPGRFVDYNSDGDYVLLQGSRRTWGTLYLGLTYKYRFSRLSIGDGSVLPDELRTRREKFNGMGPQMEWDRRDGPTTGTLIEVAAMFNRDVFGSDRDYNRYDVSLSGYTTLGDSTRVLAGLVVAQVATGDVPFDDQAVLGYDNMRGYTNGEHRGDQVYALEGEFRWNFYRRLGLAAFGGVGWAVDKFSEFSLSDALPAAGFGLRFMMVPEYRINVRVDYARGKDDEGFYFMIGEAF